jgi:uncharacterized protein (TIGR01777 family)
MQTVAITGANGFVGSNLIIFFKSLGYTIIPINREDLLHEKKLEAKILQANIVINLAGANIIQRWSKSYKKELYSSRIDTTQKIVHAINTITSKPKLFISTSAVGIYDNTQMQEEDHASYGNDFLANLCKDWEKEAHKANCSVVIFRFGIVLGKNGGALEKMLLPFKMGVGGPIGKGQQAFSFVHMYDLQHAFKFAIENDSLNGAYNLCAPTPTTNMGLTKALGRTLGRPTFFTVPQFLLKLRFGEGATVLCDGQSAVPKRLQEAGFEFKFHTIEESIEDLCTSG